MEAAHPPAKRIDVGAVIGETFSIYGQNAVALLGSAAAVFVAIGLVSGLLQNAGGLALGLLAGAVKLGGYALYTGFVVRLVEDVRDGRRDHTAGDLFSAAMPAILPLVGFAILFGIGIGIGFFLLVVPGLVLLTFWSVGAPAIVLERAGPIDAFGRSWRLVRGNAWPVFGTLLVAFLIVIAVSFILAAIGIALGQIAALVVGSILSSVITAPIFALAVSEIYFELAGDDATTRVP